MAKDAPELLAHKEWLGQIQQVGLVVSPHVLVKNGVGINREDSLRVQTALRELARDGDEPRVNSFHEFATTVLDWPVELLAGAPGGPDVPEDLTIALPEYEDRLAPAYVLSQASEGPGSSPPATSSHVLLVTLAPTGADLDKPLPDQKDGWRASPHARLERLLRESGLSIGLLFNHTHVRLVYAPKGESSGHLTFRFKHLLETLGRPMAGALYALLGARRVTDVLPDAERLPALLQESRKYQNVVSTRLAEQVLEALWELLRGFQRANDDTKGALLADALRENPQEVYGGLLSTLMRLVFILYAEDRGLMPGSDVYQKHYSVSGLFERLREDAARYPDTMDARYGAWAQLLALFRLIHDGGGHAEFRFPARHGRLFNPDSYPFLEGRPHGSVRVKGAAVHPPRVPDGVIFRVLQNLLVLDGERLSYRALDVEQIGSVYEAMMGFALQQAAGPSVAVRPKHIVVNLAELLEQKPKDRAAWLAKVTELKVGGDALSRARTVEELVDAIGKKISKEYTPAPLPAGAMYLQPTEERRRSGSHYTPRSLTEPIVRTTFRPIFERLGDNATPEQILDLKVCDPAMGSGAFLVEACRLLAERLVRAWEVQKSTPRVPDDEDVTTYARRLVAERCLYGVDKNIFAVDLAKLSLWLATLARDHPFTFLDHSLRHGDSLVGLSTEQIACFNWEVGKQLPLLRSLIDDRVQQAQRLREQIQAMGDSDDVPAKSQLLREANETLDDVRRIGNLAVSAFFEREKPKDRKVLLTTYVADVEAWLSGAARTLAEGAMQLTPFHWQIEFPEVFTRDNSGFDAFVGNPPFAGKNTITASNGASYLQWLLELHEESHGNADLVAHFFRRTFNLLRPGGAFGLIATNTIAQGDTRATGLRWIRKHDGVIFAARKRVRWPGRAAVVVSVVYILKGDAPVDFDLDGKHVDVITAFLFHSGRDDDPMPLRENKGGAFRGMEIGLPELVIKRGDSRFEQLKSIRDPRNAEWPLLKPYLGGEEILGSPIVTSDRFVIDIDRLSSDAIKKLGLLALAERPSWNFRRPSLLLRERLCRQERLLAMVRHTDTTALQFLPACVIPNEATICFSAYSYAAFATLQSRIHELWYRFLGSTIKDDPRYTPSDCFDTFPLPIDWTSNAQLEAIGQEYYEFRAKLMVLNNEGLTKTYNRFHDPDEQSTDILKLRQLHDTMDRAVLDAYDWSNISLTCEFILDYQNEDDEDARTAHRRKKPWRYRWPDDLRDEVLVRLLELNARRAAAAIPPRSHMSSASPRTAKRRSTTADDVPNLFADRDH